MQLIKSYYSDDGKIKVNLLRGVACSYLDVFENEKYRETLMFPEFMHNNNRAEDIAEDIVMGQFRSGHTALGNPRE